MTPKVHRDTGVNTDLNLRPQTYPQRGPTTPEKGPTRQVERGPDSICCFCLKPRHGVYDCDWPGKEKFIVQIHRQESLLDFYEKQGRDRSNVSLDSQKLDAIATTRRLTNPLGKNWEELPNEYLSGIPDKSTNFKKSGCGAVTKGQQATWVNN